MQEMIINKVIALVKLNSQNLLSFNNHSIKNKKTKGCLGNSIRIHAVDELQYKICESINI